MQIKDNQDRRLQTMLTQDVVRMADEIFNLDLLSTSFVDYYHYYFAVNWAKMWVDSVGMDEEVALKKERC